MFGSVNRVKERRDFSLVVGGLLLWLATGCARSATAPETKGTSLLAPPVASANVTPLSQTSDGRWWCTSDGFCSAIREQCIADVAASKGACESHDTAFCAHGCWREADGMPVCGNHCTVTRERCELLPIGPCTEAPPPRRLPELFESYSTPGWWCWELPRAEQGDDLESHCAKERELCDWELAGQVSTLRSAGSLARDTLGQVACSRPKSAPWCVRYTVENRVTFSCSLTRSACERVVAQLPGMRRNAAAAGLRLMVPESPRCETWAND